MKINIQYYQDKYHYSSETKAGKLIDNWREGIKLLPFTSNPGSAVDKNVGLAGATGAFFRLYEKTPANAAIEDSSVTESLIRDYLKEKRNMPDQQVDEFIEMWYDLKIGRASCRERVLRLV